ncbi:MAG: hypothetical protein NTV89_02440, partial [Proteobacteria bacterium]|nr:hypothetical protein [Pseudomonadota bacterium]
MKIKYTNRFLSFLLFVIPLFFTPNAFAGISDGLVAYYPFNGAANDASGNGNNGTVAGATLTEDRFGNASSAYSFDGNDDKITVSDAPALNFGTGSFTLAVWIQNNQSGIWKRILTKRGSASYWYSLSIYSGKARLEISAGVSLDSTVAINDNAWHFLLVKRDTTAGVFSLYVDGELPSTMSDAGQNLN